MPRIGLLILLVATALPAGAEETISFDFQNLLRELEAHDWNDHFNPPISYLVVVQFEDPKRRETLKVRLETGIELVTRSAGIQIFRSEDHSRAIAEMDPEVFALSNGELTLTLSAFPITTSRGAETGSHVYNIVLSLKARTGACPTFSAPESLPEWQKPLWTRQHMFALREDTYVGFGPNLEQNASDSARQLLEALAVEILKQRPDMRK